MNEIVEELITAILDDESVAFTPNSRMEEYLTKCLEGGGVEGLPKPISRLDILLYQLCDKFSGLSTGNNLPNAEEVSF